MRLVLPSGPITTSTRPVAAWSSSRTSSRIRSIVTVTEPDGRVSKEGYVTTFKGKKQLRFAPFYSHNTGEKAIGCGECQQGQIWEAAMAAAQFRLDNLITFQDNNGVQLDGNTADIMQVEPLVDKWKAFRWEVFTCDGHDFEELVEAVEEAKKIKGKPSMIVAKTVKGKGISFMENTSTWHGVKDPSLLEDALKEVMYEDDD